MGVVDCGCEGLRIGIDVIGARVADCGLLV